MTEHNSGYSVEYLPGDPRGRNPRREHTVGGPVRVYRVGDEGNAEFGFLGNDVGTIQTLAEKWAKEKGLELVNLTATLKRGRQTMQEQERRAALAQIVTRLRAAGARLQPIASVLGCTKSTVSALERAAQT